MILTINLKSINSAGITPNEVFYLIGLHQKQPVSYYLDLTNLENKGYIKRIIDDDTSIQEVILRGPALKLMKTIGIDAADDIEGFVEDYRALFPVGVRNSSGPVRGDRKACIDKMKTFKRNYPYTNEEILEATRIYLVTKKKEGWNCTQAAHYYIEKDGISALSAACEDMRLKVNQIKEGVISGGAGQSTDI